MKDLGMLVFFTQLGLSVVVPLVGFVLLGVWLDQSCGWGVWTVIVGVILGLLFAFEGLRSTLKTMERFAKEKDRSQPRGFNEHD